LRRVPRLETAPSGAMEISSSNTRSPPRSSLYSVGWAARPRPGTARSGAQARTAADSTAGSDPARTKIHPSRLTLLSRLSLSIPLLGEHERRLDVKLSVHSTDSFAASDPSFQDGLEGGTGRGHVERATSVSPGPRQFRRDLQRPKNERKHPSRRRHWRHSRQ
jgi:hypothetical protein